MPQKDQQWECHEPWIMINSILFTWAPKNKQQKTFQEGSFWKEAWSHGEGRTTPSTVSVMTKAKEA